MIETANQQTLFELVSSGGWVMIPLLLCSLIAITIIIERLFWGLRRSNVIPPLFVSQVRQLISTQKIDQLIGVCRAGNFPAARIIAVAVEHSDYPRQEILELIQSAGRQEAQKLQRLVSTLGTIAAISPLLGLLGTVLGMIKTFRVIQLQGLGNSEALAGGISEALLTTASGLTIAIPCLVFHRFFIHITRRLVADMETLSLETLQGLSRSKPTEEKSRQNAL